MLYTGKKVESNDTTIEMSVISMIEGKPKAKIRTPDKLSPSVLLILLQTMALIRIALIQLIKTITIDSLKKILKTSRLLAPTARRIPISRFLLIIETVIKLNNNKVAKIARIMPAHKKTDDKT